MSNEENRVDVSFRLFYARPMLFFAFFLILAEDSHREQVIQLLDTSAAPVVPEAFTTAAGGHPDSVLASIVGDDQLHPSLRKAAVLALSAFKSDVAKQSLKALLIEGITPLRRSAVYALGRDYKESSDTYDALVTAMDDEKVAVRKAAARMLAASPQRKARTVLVQHAQSDPSVRELIEKLLK